jgi:hypothetical protein
MMMTRISLGPIGLDVPPDWSLSSLILAGPRPTESPAAAQASRPFQRNLIITLEKVEPEETPEAYFDRQEAGLRAANVESGIIVGPDEVELSGGNWGTLTERIVVSPDGERVRQLQLVTIKNGVAYTLIASHVDGRPFEEVREEFKGILTSFA